MSKSNLDEASMFYININGLGYAFAAGFFACLGYLYIGQRYFVEQTSIFYINL